MDIKMLSCPLEGKHFQELVNRIEKNLISLLKASTISLDDFERHTEVSVDRYIAYTTKQDKIDTLKDMKKMRMIKVDTSTLNIKSDCDHDIDKRYAMTEYHLIKDRVFIRIIFNSVLINNRVIKMNEFLEALCMDISKTDKCDLILIEGESEIFKAYRGNVLSNAIAKGEGTFDIVSAMYNFRIGHIMERIDKNVDVLLAPRMVKELERYILEANKMIKSFKDLKIDEPEMIDDNQRIIDEATSLLEESRNLMYENITVEERYFKLNM